MEIKRRTEITIAKQKRLVVPVPETSEQVPCPRCAGLMITAEHAASLLHVSRRVVYQLVESGTAHWLETEAGILLVCPNSLPPTSEGENL